MSARFSTSLLVAALGTALLVSGCSLRQTKTRIISEPTVTTTIVVPGKQALNWSVTSSYFASSSVTLSYELCRNQKLVGAPVVAASSTDVAITLWASQVTCTNPIPHTITVTLPSTLGNRPLTNPQLLQ